jgi:hypothetical protein
MTRTDVRVNVGGVVSPSATSSTRLTNYTILTSPFHTGACTEVDSVEQPESFDVQTYEAWTRALAVENKRWPFSIYGSAAYTVFDQGFILHQDPGTSYLQSGPSTETGGSFSTKIRGVSPINSTRPSAFSSYSIETRFNPVTSNDLEIPPWLTQSGLFWNGVTSISIGIPGIPNGTSAHLFTASIHDFGDAAQTEEECLLNYAISDGKLRPLGPQSITNPATGIPALLMLAPRPSRPISVGLGPNNSLVNRTSYFTSIPGCVPEPNSGHTITIAPSCF